MKGFDILSLLANDNFIVVNKDLAREWGIDVAILFGELASEYRYYKKNGELEDGWFYSTVDNVEENTSLSDFRQRKAIKLLEEKNIIEVKIKGIPAKRYIKINEEQVLKLFDSQFFKNSRTSSLKNKEQDIEKLKGNNNNINNNKKNNNNINSSSSSYVSSSHKDIVEEEGNFKDEDDKKDILKVLEENFCRPLSSFEIEYILEQEKTYSYDVLCLAIKQCVIYNVRNIRYLQSILQNWYGKSLDEINTMIEQNRKKDEERPDIRKMDVNKLEQLIQEGKIDGVTGEWLV